MSLAALFWGLCILGPCSAGSGGSGVSGALLSLAALFLPIFMHSLGDVWHLGSEDLESLQVLGPCYLYAFLR